MRTYYCSYCCLWSQRDFCNRLERSRTWEPFILLAFPAWEFISSRIVISGFVGMGKSIWGRNRDYFFFIPSGWLGSLQSWKLWCSLNLSYHRCIYVHFSSDHKYAFIAHLLIISLTTLQCALLCASCSHSWVQELGFSQVELVQSAPFKHSQLSGQSQDRWDQEPLKCVQRGCQPLLSFTSQILLLCHVSIMSLCCHSSLEGNMCTTPSLPVVHPFLGVRQ